MSGSIKVIYGPNHDAVASFIEQLPRIPWCAALGEPTDSDDLLVRVGLEDVLALHPSSYQLWGDLLLTHEASIDRLILSSGRLGADDALQSSVRIAGDSIDDFFVNLAQTFPDYYKDSHSYAHELIDPPVRLVRYAAREILVSDLADMHFFRDLMPWFKRGHWPIGWQGHWPDGKLILW
jgi:hypothetical protein